ncbi:MAG TPA: DUF692 family protein [Planctomycetota bacterium]|nr:DUF692 family protein [Planctomycetota bacterium]
MIDRFGIGWRPALAAGILACADRIDVVEAMAEDFVDRAALATLRALTRTLPVTVHALSLGLASTIPVDEERLAAVARAVAAAGAPAWSEHLAFVRAGGIEIGHLCAPPRCAATLDGLMRNLRRARAVVGAAPWLENVATLIEPPGSDRDETAWARDVAAATGHPLLVDLHNLHANSVNFAFDPAAWIDALPAAAISGVHLAGGAWLEERWLDDHRHDVPDPVFALLERLAAHASRPLTVIIERDGAFPPMGALLAQLDRARAAVARGRRQRVLAGV